MLENIVIEQFTSDRSLCLRGMNERGEGDCWIEGAYCKEICCVTK